MAYRVRVYLPEPSPQGDGTVRLPDDEAHHVRRVLRLRPGDDLSLFDGAGGEWSATLTRVGPDGVWARRGDPVAGRVDCSVAVSLYQGWCEPARLEWLLQKGTELGLAAIHPVGSGSGGRPPSDRRRRRWRRIAVEAAKQCGRRSLPRIEPVGEPPGSPDTGILALLLHAGPRSTPLAERLADAAPRGVWIAVGPAGGWEADTVERLSAAGWLPCSLGPRTLRAETAGIAAATVVLHRLGDLGSERSAEGAGAV